MNQSKHATQSGYNRKGLLYTQNQQRTNECIVRWDIIESFIGQAVLAEILCERKWVEVWRHLWELHQYPTTAIYIVLYWKAPENQGRKNRGQESREYWTTEVFQLSLHASERKHNPSNLLLNKALRETWSISWRSTENPCWLLLRWEHRPSWLMEFIKLKHVFFMEGLSRLAKAGIIPNHKFFS